MNMTSLKTYYRYFNSDKSEECKITLNDNQTFDVIGSVNTEKKFSQLPVVFNKVKGSFFMHEVGLTSLVNSPRLITGDLDLLDNKLSNLIGAPLEVGGCIDLARNPLTSLEHLPKMTGRGTLFLTYSKNLPLLRLVCLPENISIGISPDNGEFQISLSKINREIYFYREEQPNKKKAVLDFQRYLIDNNLHGNAVF